MSKQQILFKIYGREQLTWAKDLNLGLQIGSLNSSSIGMAEDTVLIATDIISLFYDLL